MIVTWLSYILYSYFLFYYVAKIFGKPNIKLPVLGIMLVINSFLVYDCLFISRFRYELLIIFIYFIVLALEIGIAYKLPLISTLAATLCFTINFFGVKILLMGILSLSTQHQTHEFISELDNRMLILILTFVILAGYITISSRILIHKVVKFLFADIASLKLCCILLSVVVVNQALSLPTIYVKTQNPSFNSIYQIRTSLIALVSFVIIMVAVFLYSKLRQASITYMDTSVEIHSESIAIHKLKKEVEIDFFTGFYIRSVAIDKLKEFIMLKEYCYILFIDLDGLKKVNDGFGHEEGDIYIKTTSDFIAEAFTGDTISRVGGDEFLIIGNNQSENIKTRIEGCYNRVLNMKKEYDTSISYGFIEIYEDNLLSHDELIEIADKEMYAFKKSRKKERKSRVIDYLRP